MDKIKKVIVLMILILLILLIILLVVLVRIKLNNNMSTNINKDKIQGDEGEVLNITNEEVDVDNISKVKIVENAIQKYFDTININSSKYFSRNAQGENVRTVTEAEIYKSVLEMLSSEYKNKNNINEENINQKINLLNEKLIIITLKNKEIVKENTEKFCVNAIAVNEENKLKSNFCIFVNLDIKNKTFSIEPIDSNNETFDNIKIINNDERIVPTNNNTYTDLSWGNEQLINKYINDFKKIAIAAPKISYNYVEEDYKRLKFSDEEKYIAYIQKNKDRILKADLSKYRVRYSENYNEFICVDQNNFYYIFRQEKNKPLNYNVVLDTYTIDASEFIEKYNNGNAQQKVGMNIEKIISAINCKDYEYIYDKLDETYKKNNFPTIERLEEVLKNNAFDINNVSYDSFKENGNDIYTYNITIKAVDSETTRQMTVIVKLLEDRNFIFSFSFN